MKRILLLSLAFLCLPSFIVSSFGTDLDTTFNKTGYNSNIIQGTPQQAVAKAVATQTDGKYVTTGQAFTTQRVVALARYNLDGSLDSSTLNGNSPFGVHGFITTAIEKDAHTNSIAIYNDTTNTTSNYANNINKIVVGGATNTSSQTKALIVRYNQNGDIDTSFGTDGIITFGIDSNSNTIISSVKIQEDGKIVAVGFTLTAHGPIGFITRYTSNGQPDMFGTNGIRTFTADNFDICAAISVIPQSDGSYTVLCNNSNTSTSTSSVGLIGISSDGTTVTTYDSLNINSTAIERSTDFTQQADGKYIATGTVGGQVFVARWNSNRTIDGFFGAGGYATLSIANSKGLRASSVNLDDNNKIIIAGFLTLPKTDGTQQGLIIRYNSDGSLDTTFSSPSSSTYPATGYITQTIPGYQTTVYDSFLQSDKKIILVGQYTHDESLQQGIIIIRCVGDNESDILDPNFNVNETPGYTISSIPDGVQDASAQALAKQSTGKYITAGQAYTTQQVVALARYNTDGTLDQNFGTSGYMTTALGISAYATSLVIDSDDKIIVAANTTTSQGQTISLIRYTSEGSLDTSFGLNGVTNLIINANATNIVNRVKIESSTGKILIIGQTDDYGYIARYTSNGTLDTSFGSGTGFMTFTLANNLSCNAISFEFITTDSSYMILCNNIPTIDSVSSVGLIQIYNDGSSSYIPTDTVVDINASYQEDAADFIVQPDGKFVATGTINNQIFIARWNKNGSADRSFGTNGSSALAVDGATNLTAASINLNKNNEILVTGYLTINNIQQIIIARFNTNGSLDTYFNAPHGYITQPLASYAITAHDTILEGNQDLVIAGQYTDTSGNSGIIILRCTDQTNKAILDNSFGLQGVVTTTIPSGLEIASAQSIATQSDSKIITTGQAFTTQNIVALARYNTDGSIDTTFGLNNNGIVTTAVGKSAASHAIAIQSDDKIVVVGSTTTDGLEKVLIIRYTQDGLLDTTFNSSSSTPGIVTLINSSSTYNPTINVAYAVAIDTNNKIIVTGKTQDPSHATYPYEFVFVARYNSNGTLDASFKGGGRTNFTYGTGASGMAIALESTDSMIILINFYQNNDKSISYTIPVRVYSSSTANQHFRFNSTKGMVGSDLKLDSDGKPVATGTYIDPVTRARSIFVARWKSDGKIDTTFNPSQGYTLLSIPSSSNLTGTTLNFDVGDDAGKILTIGYVTTSGKDQVIIARYTANGTLDTSFNQDSNTPGYTLQSLSGYKLKAFDSLLQTDQKLLIAGQYTTTDSTTTQGIMLLRMLNENEENILDTTFNTTGYNITTIAPSPETASAQSVAQQSNGYYVTAGQATTTQQVVTLARYTQEGELDLAFGPHGTGIVTTAIGTSAYATSIVVYPAGDYEDKIVIVGTTAIGSIQYALIIRYNADGSLDTTFGDNGIVTTSYPTTNFTADINIAYDVILDANQEIVITGKTQDSSLTIGFVARYNSTDGTLDTNYNAGQGDNSYGVALQRTSSGDIAMLCNYIDENNSNNQNITIIEFDTNLIPSQTFTPITIDSTTDIIGRDFIIDEHGIFIVTGNYLDTNNNIIISSWNSNGTVNTNFGTDGYTTLPIPNATNLVASAISLSAYDEFIVTGYCTLNSQEQIIIARFTNSGNVDQSFNEQQTPGYITAPLENYGVKAYGSVLQENQDLIVAGQYTDTDANKGIIILRYLGQKDIATLDDTFNEDDTPGYNPNFTTAAPQHAQAEALATQSTGKIITAGQAFTTQNVIVIARYLNGTTNGTDGTLDTSFGTAGYVTTAIGTSAQATSIVIDANDNIVVGGYATTTTGQVGFITRYTTNGLLDESFGSNGIVTLAINASTTNRINSIKIQNDGKIVVVGSTLSGTNTLGFIARYTTSGALDTATFNGSTGYKTFTGSSTTYCNPMSLLILSDGSFIVACDNGSGGSSTVGLISVTSNGTTTSTKSSINIDGDYAEYTADFIQQPDDKYVVVGTVNNKIFVARWNSDGTVDTAGFNTTNGFITLSISGATGLTASSVNLDENNKILVTGFLTYNNIQQALIARYNTNGTLDTTFSSPSSSTNSNGYITQSISPYQITAHDSLIQSDKKIIIAGQYTDENEDQGILILRCLGDNEANLPDETFNYIDSSTYGYNISSVIPGGYYPASARAMATQSDGKFVTAGYARTTQDVVAVARYNTDGTLDTTFGTNGYVVTSIGTAAYATTITIDADDKILIAGSATTSSYGQTILIIRYNADGSLDTENFNAAGETPGILTPSNLLSSTNITNTIKIQDDGKIVIVGQVDTLGFIARFNSNGTVDTTFGSTSGALIFTLASNQYCNAISFEFIPENESYMVLCDTIAPTTGSGSVGIVEINSNGTGYFIPANSTIDADAGYQEYAADFTQQPDGKYVGVGTVNNKMFATRWNTNGSVDVDFGNNGSTTFTIPNATNLHATTVNLNKNNEILLIGYATLNDQEQIFIARCNIDGTIDTYFNNTGYVIAPISTYNVKAYDSILQPNQELIIAGQYSDTENTGIIILRCLDQKNDPQLDTDFNTTGYNLSVIPDGLQLATAQAVAMQADNKIVTAGQAFTTQDVVALARYNADGSLDTTFGPNGTGIVTTAVGASAGANAIAIQSDGKIVIAGSTTANGIEKALIIRYNTNGFLDSTFNASSASPGIITHVSSSFNASSTSGYNPTVNIAYDVVIDTDNNIIITGKTQDSSHMQYSYSLIFVAQYTSSGARDTTFNNGAGYINLGYSYNLSGIALKVDVNGYINILVNYSNNQDGTSQNTVIIRINQSGTITQQNFTPITKNSAVNIIGSDLILDQFGKCVATGTYIDTTTGIRSIITIRWNTNGTLDTTYNPSLGYNLFSVDNSTDLTASSIILDTRDDNNRLIVTGYINPYNTTLQPIVLRYTTNGILDQSFYVPVSGYEITALASAAQSDGKLVIAGSYTTTADTTTQGIALLRCLSENQTPSLDTRFNNSGYNTDLIESYQQSAIAYAVATQSSGKIVTVGQATTTQPVIAVCRYNSDGTTDTTFGQNSAGWTTTLLGVTAQATAISIQSDDKILVAGTTTNSSGDDAACLARYTASGLLDTGFNSTGIITLSAGYAINTVTVDGNGKIVVIGTTSHDHMDQEAFITRFNSDGSYDATFNNGIIRIFTTGNNNTCSGISLKVINTNTYMVLCDNINYSNNLFSNSLVQVASDGGSCTVLSGSDYSFGAGYTQNAADFTTQPDGKYLATGTITTTNPENPDTHQVYVLRWNTNGTLDTTFGGAYGSGSGGALFSIIPNSTNLLATSINLDEYNKIVVTGYITTPATDGTQKMIIMRFYIDGTLDTSLGNGTGYIIQDIGDLQVAPYNTWQDANNKLLLAGQFSHEDTTTNDTQGMIISRLEPVGQEGPVASLDTTFSSDGYDTFTYSSGYPSIGNAIITQAYQDKIFIAGQLNYSSGGVPAIIAYKSDGTRNSDFGTSGYTTIPNVFGSANALDQDSNSNIIMSGQYQNGSNYSIFLAKILSSGFPDQSFGGGDGYIIWNTITSSAPNSHAVLVQPDNKIIMSSVLYFNDTINVQRFNPDGSSDPSFSGDGLATRSETDRTLVDHALAFYSNDKIAALYYAYRNDGDQTKETRILPLNSDGSVDGNIGGGVIILNASGAQDTKPGGIAVQSDNKFVVAGSYSAVKNTAPFSIYVARILSNGSMDTDFGTLGTGFVYFSTNTIANCSNLTATAVNLFDDSKILVTGYATIDGVNKIIAIRYNYDGSLDTTFAPEGYIVQQISSGSATANGCVIQADQSFLTTGQYTTNSSLLVNRFTNFQQTMPETSLDTTFDTDGYNITNQNNVPYYGYAVGAQSDGRLIVGGKSVEWNNNNKTSSKIQRFSTTGVLDTTFGSNEHLTYDNAIYGMAIQPDNKIVGVGYALFNGNYYSVVGRYTANGLFDTTANGSSQPFGNEGFNLAPYSSTNSHNAARAVTVQSDGKIVFSSVYNDLLYIYRYNSDATLDTTFNNDGVVTINRTSSWDTAIGLYTIYNSSNTGIVVLSTQYTSNTAASTRIDCLQSSNGNFDNNFDDDGQKICNISGADQSISADLKVQPDNKFVFVGTYFMTANTQPSGIFVQRCDNRGVMDSSFGVNGVVKFELNNATNLTATAVNLYADDKILVTGYVTLNGITQLVAIRYNTDGSLDTTFAAAGYILQPYIRNASSNTSSNGTLFNTTINDALIQPNQKFVVAGTDTTWGAMFISRLETMSKEFQVDTEFGNTGDTDFNSEGYNITCIGGPIQNPTAHAMALQSDGKIVTAGQSIVNNGNVVTLARFLDDTNNETDGEIDTTFGGSGTGFATTEIPGWTCGANAMAIYPATGSSYDNKILIAGYSLLHGNVPGEEVNLIARYNADGTLDTTSGFGINGSGYNNQVNIGLSRAVAINPRNNSITAVGNWGVNGFTVHYDSNGKLYNNNIYYIFNIYGSSNEQIQNQAVGIQSNDYIVVVCNKIYSSTSGSVLINIYNLHSYNVGSIDYTSNFNTSYSYTNAGTMLMFNDNKFLVAGTTHNTTGNQSIFLAKFNANASIDSSFGATSGYTTLSIPGASNLIISSIDIDENNKYLVTGSCSFYGIEQTIVARFLNDGTVDPSFVSTTSNSGSTPGYVIDSIYGYQTTANDALFNANQQLLIAGQYTDLDLIKGIIVSRYLDKVTQAAQLDATFDIDGFVTTNIGGAFNNSIANVVALQSDGNIVTAGQSTQAQDVITLARYIGAQGATGTQGTLDTTFGTQGTGFITTTIGTSAQAYGMAIYPNTGNVEFDNKIVVVGNTISDTGANLAFIARYNAHGTLDTTFNPSGSTPGVVTTAYNSNYFISQMNIAYDVALQSDGKILVTGVTDNDTSSTLSYIVIARYNTDGSLDTSFYNTENDTDINNDTYGYIIYSQGYNSYGKAIALQVNGQIVLMSNAYTNSDLSEQNIDIAFMSPTAQPVIRTYAEVIHLENSENIIGTDLILQSNGQIVVVGNYVNGSNPSEIFVGRWNSDGTIDTNFASPDGYTTLAIPGGTNLTTTSVLLDINNRILVSGYVTVDDIEQLFVACYTTNGILDDSFNYTSEDERLGYFVGTLDDYTLTTNDTVFDSNYKMIIAGQYTNIANPEPGISISRYVNTVLEPAQLDTQNFNPDLGYNTTLIGGDYLEGSARAVAMQSDGKIITAGISTQIQDVITLARYTTDGKIDTTFGAAGTGYVTTMIGASAFANDIAIYNNTANTNSNYSSNLDKIVITGGVTNGSNQYGTIVARYTKDGILDSSPTNNTPFTNKGYIESFFGSSVENGGYGVAIQDNGRIVMIGTATGEDGYLYAVVVRYMADGALDTNFHADGIRTITSGSNNLPGKKIALQADQKIVILYERTDGNTTNTIIRRLTTSGYNDGTFNNDTFISLDYGDQTYAGDIIVQPDGKILATGSYLVLANTQPSNIFTARFNTDGSIDATFATDGLATLSVDDSTQLTATSIALDIDNRILVSGYVTIPEENGKQEAIVARYTVNGVADSSFSSTPYIGYVIGTINGYHIAAYDTLFYNRDNDQKLVIVGQSITDNEAATKSMIVSRFDSIVVDYAKLDPTFDFDGYNTTTIGGAFYNPQARSVGLQSTGKYVIAGQSTQTQDVVTLARYTATGEIDTTFGIDGFVTTTVGTSAHANALIVYPSGTYEDKIVIVGTTTIGSVQYAIIIRYNADGSLDATFGNNGIVTASYPATDFTPDINIAYDVTLDANQKIIITGKAQDLSLTIGFIARYNSTNGTLDTNYNAGQGDNSYGVAVHVASDGNITMLCNYIDENNSNNQNMTIIEFDANLIPSQTFTPITINSTTNIIGYDFIIDQNESYVVAGSYLDANNNSVVIASWNTDGTINTNFGTNGYTVLPIENATQLTIANISTTEKGQFLITGSLQINSLSYMVIARFNSDGSLDKTFGSDGTSYVIITLSDYQTGAGAALFDTDENFVIAGHYIDTSSTQGLIISRYKSTVEQPMTLDTQNFNSSDGFNTTSVGGAFVDGIAYGVAIQSDGKVVAAGVSTQNQDVITLVRYTTAGIVDTTFGNNGFVTTAIGTSTLAYGIAIYNNPANTNSNYANNLDKIYVAGTTRNNINENGMLIARYTKDGILDTSSTNNTAFTSEGYISFRFGASENTAYANAIQDDGKILVAGTASGLPGTQSGDTGALNGVIYRYNIDGTLDTSFSGDGYHTDSYYANNNIYRKVVVQPDQKILAGYEVTVNAYPNETDTMIMRLNPSGSRDATFSQSNQYHEVRLEVGRQTFLGDIALQNDKKMVIVGTYFTTSNTQPSEIYVTRRNEDGSADTSFATNGLATLAITNSTNLTATAVNIDEKNRIIVTGYVTYDGKEQLVTARYTTDGTLDQSFSASPFIGYVIGSIDGYEITSYDAIFDTDYKLVIAGASININDNSQEIIVSRYINIAEEETTPDPTFNSDGFVTTAVGGPFINGIANAIATQSDGKIIAAGVSTQTQDVITLVRYTTAGTVDTTFGVNGYVITSIGSSTEANDIVIYNDTTNTNSNYASNLDKIVVIGSTKKGSGESGNLVARYTKDGQLDTSSTSNTAFTSQGYVAYRYGSPNNIAYGTTLQSDGKILIAGTASGLEGSASYDTGSLNGIVYRYNVNGTLDTSFSGNGYHDDSYQGSNNIYRRVKVQSNQKIITGYETTSTSNLNKTTTVIRRLKSDGWADDTFNPSSTYHTITIDLGAQTLLGDIIVQPIDNKIIIAGTYFTTANTQPSAVYVTRYNEDGSADTTFGTNGRATLTIPNGTNLTTTSGVLDINERILVSGYVTLNGIQQLFVACYTPNGILDTSFNSENNSGYITAPLYNYSVTCHDSLIDLNNKMIFAGQYTTTNSSATKGMILSQFINTVVEPAQLDTTFDTDGYNTTTIGGSFDDETAHALGVQSTGKIVAAGTSTQTQDVITLVRYTTSGDVDTTFGVNGYVTTTIGHNAQATDVAIYTTNDTNLDKIVVVGTTTTNDVTSMFIMRYTANGVLDTSSMNNTPFTTNGYTVANFTSSSTNTVHKVNIQNNGKVVIVGQSGNQGVIARYNLDGSLDTTFGITNSNNGFKLLNGDDGRVNNPTSFTILSDGSFIIYCDTNLETTYSIVLLSVSSNGSSQSLFSDFINVAGDYREYGADFTVQPDGKYVGVGTTNSDPAEIFVVRWNSNGDLDTTFAAQGYTTLTVPDSTNLQAATINLDSNNRIVVTGNVTTTNDGLQKLLVARYTVNGVADTSFSSTPYIGYVVSTIPNYQVVGHAALFDAQNRFMIAGQSIDNENSKSIILSRFVNIVNDPARLDLTFDVDGFNTTAIGGPFQEAVGMALAKQSDNKLIVAGNAVQTQPLITLIRYIGISTDDTDGKVDITFGTNNNGYITTAVGQAAEIQSMVVYPRNTDHADKIVVAGSTTTGSTTSALLIRYNSDGTIDDTFGNDGIVTSVYNSPNFNPTTNIIYDIIFGVSGKIIVTGLTADDTQTLSFLARYNTDGTLDESFNGTGYINFTAANGVPGNYSVAAQVVSTGQIVTLSSPAGNNTDIVLNRFNTDGTQDPFFAWATTTDESYATVSLGTPAVAADLTVQLVNGNLVAVGMTNSALFIARWSSAGILDLDFGGQGTGYATLSVAGYTNLRASKVNLINQGQFLVTGSLEQNGKSFMIVARYNNDGTLDHNFDEDGKGYVIATLSDYQTTANDTLLQNDFKFVITGQYTDPNSTQGIIISRYLGGQSDTTSIEAHNQLPAVVIYGLNVDLFINFLHVDIYTQLITNPAARQATTQAIYQIITDYINDNKNEPNFDYLSNLDTTQQARNLAHLILLQAFSDDQVTVNEINSFFESFRRRLTNLKQNQPS